MRAPRLRKKSRPLRPISSMVTVASPCSATNRCAPLMRLLLNAPARPLSLVRSTSRMLRGGLCATSGFAPASASTAAAAATLASTFASSVAYGRAAITRSCARRSFAAETIFMALVICCVFFTDRMRRRMSIRLGMRGYRGLVRHEPRLELYNRGLHFVAEGVVQSLLVPNLVEDVAVRVLDEAIQLFFELAALLHR